MGLSSPLLIPVGEQAGSSFYWSEAKKTGFLMIGLICRSQCQGQRRQHPTPSGSGGEPDKGHRFSSRAQSRQLFPE